MEGGQSVLVFIHEIHFNYNLHRGISIQNEYYDDQNMNGAAEKAGKTIGRGSRLSKLQNRIRISENYTQSIQLSTTFKTVNKVVRVESIYDFLDVFIIISS